MKKYIIPTSRPIALYEEAELMQGGSKIVDIDGEEDVNGSDKTRRQGSGNAIWDAWGN